jgi:two-component system response regulator AtoC
VVTRLGSNRPREIDVRFLAATNRDLEADCQTGRFRRDLYFRLSGITLHIPPLRERPREIDDLARTFLVAACRMLERAEVPRISSEVLDLLRAHAWPGNVRELRNVIERAAVLCPGDAILPEHLPAAMIKATGAAAGCAGTGAPSSLGPHSSDAASAQVDLPAQIRSLECTRIVETLERCGGSQTQAARVLGISRRTLISRIEAFGLARPRKRAEGDRRS